MIPTVDRAVALLRLVDGLRWQTHPSFEVIAVVGPTRDDTVDRLIATGLPIKLVRCPARNLSMARNLGIDAAAGDVVAFVDDDAVPEPNWLEELVTPFHRPDVAAAGGWVFDRTGVRLQYPTMLATRLGSTRPIDDGRSAERRCFPCSWEFPYAPGGNAAYRRSTLMEIGGFDEVIEYYLDETDVSARLIDHGWIVTSIAGAAIHHKHLPSAVRAEGDALRDLYPIVKNRAYFAFKHAAERVTEADIERVTKAFRDDLLTATRAQAASGDLDAAELADIEGRVSTAIDDGRRAALATPSPRPVASGHQSAFVPFPSRGTVADRCCTVVVSRQPLGAMTREPGAVELRVVEPASRDQVEFVAGVWRHGVAGPPPRALTDEVRRLRSYRHVDTIVSDVSGSAEL